MRRGDIVTVADRSDRDYTGKPRPAVIVQSDLFAATDSIVICPLTSTEVAAPLARLRVEANEDTGRRATSWIMLERISAIRRSGSARIGRLPREALVALDRMLAVFLGIA